MAEQVVWTQRENETHKAFAAFCTYRDMPPSERTVSAAYRLHSGGKGAKKPPGYFAEWSKRYEWETRAEGYDRHLDAVRLAAYEEGLREYVELELDTARKLLRQIAGHVGAGELLQSPTDLRKLAQAFRAVGLTEREAVGDEE